MNPGIIVRCRDRDWVLLPSEEEQVCLLRPLTGSSDDVVAVHRGLASLVGYDLPEERIEPSRFPPPSPDDLSDAAGAWLLWNAARLTLREGAAPLRSLGRISIRPRTYQFVPLLMALRLDPVRLFIADDVGVGKTIEALLIARELMDRREIRRFSVLCPPYLCDQWQRELREKFNIEAVVIRSSTIAGLERNKPIKQSIYEYYPVHVISIDWVKSERNRHQFLHFCPELVIVDEAHGAADAGPNRKAQQQRHRLLKEIAAGERHLILLTATPHSGIESAFLSLLGLLRPELAQWEVDAPGQELRIEVARHFVQRTRADIEKDWEDGRCFPKREPRDETFRLSGPYRQLFEQTFEFCSELVRTGAGVEQRRRRVRYWGALALLRCVMSSPAAAVAALDTRIGAIPPLEEGAEFGSFVFEATNEVTDDETPLPPIQAVRPSLADSDRRRLRELRRIAERLQDSAEDTKLTRCIDVVKELLREGYHPIVWCRYVATNEYVAAGLRRALGDRVQVTALSGRLGDEERRMKIAEIDPARPRVLVATDCLSEGINLQEKFTAVIHYDLPWNPNRLEQREGRVDRYGQPVSQVVAVRFYGRDNPVDGAVIDVLLDKARKIHKRLGTYVPVPQQSETVLQAVLNALFIRRQALDRQLSLFIDDREVRELHRLWDLDANRERTTRTRFAQRALKPAEVKRELEAVDSVLGDPTAVREFVLEACRRLNLEVRPHPRERDVFLIASSTAALAELPEVLRSALGPLGEPHANGGGYRRISFVSPTPSGAEYVGRNHRFVTALARYLFEDSLTRGGNAVAARCGVVRTTSVELLTTLLLLRVRYLVEIPASAPLLSEEVLAFGYGPLELAQQPWLDHDQALLLLSRARPTANVPPGEKRELIENALAELGDWWVEPQGSPGSNPIQSEIRRRVQQRAAALEASHKRIRKAVSLRVRELRVTPQMPPDLLGILVLQPEIRMGS
jgi:superfamily II DNA or RNA helicase